MAIVPVPERATGALSTRVPRPLLLIAAALALVIVALGAGTVVASPAGAQDVPQTPDRPTDIVVDGPVGPTGVDEIDDIEVGLIDDEGTTTQPLTIVLLLTVVGLAPTLLILLTSFTRIIIVLGITRNALSLQGVPPNQVLIGLALFLSIFVMGPVLTEINDQALQPLLEGEMSQTEAFDAGMEPLREFMLSQVREEDLAVFVDLAGDRPENPDDVALTTLIPAFVLSELRAGFIIGFLVFIPFLIIDIVVSATLMSMGMVMLPPVVISLPFKLLLFVIVDGWALLVPTLVTSFQT